MTNYQSTTQVHGWLMDVPGYRENYRNQREIMIHDDSKQFVNPSRKERPSSLASISSEDSVNLDELINANFTTDMDDETDLSALASLELDDSNEDFWKVDNVFNHYITTQLATTDKSRLKINNSNRSKYESEEELDSKNTSAEDLHDVSLYNHTTEHRFLDKLDLNSPADFDIKFSNMHLSSPPHQHRSDRSGSFSSDNSSNSQSTITITTRNTLRQNVYPSASTSTSSMSSHSTAKTSHSSFLSRPLITKSESNQTSNRLPCSRKPSLVSSISENTTVEARPTVSSTTRLPSRSASQIGLTRRATHIPAPSSSKATLSPIASTKPSPAPQRTKSTASIARKPSSTSLNRSASRIGQPSTRASHIPSPATTKRSTTSLGISSIFSSSASSTQQQKQSNTQQQQKYHPQSPGKDYSRPKTSMGTLKPSSSPSNVRSGLRTPSLMRAPSSSKSSSLKMSSSRSLYK
ncbi:hypothetical protein MAM1_0016d01498 [Mucor ambiguus]|uniref:Uncharacterized protein n=1 Tax=Mucor ambiguus TaxID=91626 RepID=A0A0C9M605_9FUNG|nr:hypothetical protein MAM1_0016d01498 [Mucor ambiguus]